MYFTLKFESFFLVYLYTELFLTGRFRKSKNVHDNSALLSQFLGEFLELHVAINIFNFEYQM